MLIQKLRLKRGWSQQQLAEASGLSARTIQRIESGQKPSIESLKSIAAVFEVDFSTLQPETHMTATDNEQDVQEDRREEEAFAYVRRLRSFYTHCFRYVIVNLILATINLIVSPDHLWVLWVVGGWGIALAMRAFRVFGPVLMLGPDWERRQVERHLGRPL
jgi:transcriptional regulator with XRE-family HTH domain